MVSYTLEALKQSLSKLESLRNSKTIIRERTLSPQARALQSMTVNNPVFDKHTRSQLRSSLGNAYLYINPDYAVDWTNPHSVVGYISEKGNFYNFIQSHENPNFEFVEKQDWENIQTKSKTVTVKDVIDCFNINTSRAHKPIKSRTKVSRDAQNTQKTKRASPRRAKTRKNRKNT